MAVISFIIYLSITITSPKIVYIPKGSVFSSIAHLQKQGVNLHLIDAVILKLIGSPQQGWIDLKEEKLNRFEYLRALTKAQAATHEVTLIPGETTIIFLSQMANDLRLDEKKLMKSYQAMTSTPEGMFAPDTYSLPKDINESGVIEFLLKRSDEKQQALSRELTGGYDKAKWLQIVTLASVIQKEAASVADMPMVSSVIQNRLAKKMRLQMDGTLNYGEFSHQKVTAQRIRTDESPYNTYKHGGIPKYPVCNVSREALHAALHPAKNDYLYFVRGKNGEHIYSSYFSTHHQNIINATK
jgi:UPF0755 protein